MQASTFNWITPDGTTLYAIDWQPEQKPQGVIVLVHGLGEHSGRYEHVAKYFTKQNWALVALDLRGHGQSEGKRGHTPSYNTFLDDIEQFLQETKHRYPNMPFVLYGHSMGGNLILNYLVRRKPEIQAVIVGAAFLRLAFAPPRLLMALGRLTQKVLPSFTQNNQVDPSHLSRDPKVGEAYVNDSLVHNRITSQTAVSVIDAGQWVIDNVGELDTPVLLMHGNQDQIITASGSRDFADNAKGQVTYKEWDGLYHEIHNEPEQLNVLTYAFEWIKSVISD